MSLLKGAPDFEADWAARSKTAGVAELAGDFAIEEQPKQSHAAWEGCEHKGSIYGQALDPRRYDSPEFLLVEQK